MKNYTNMYEHKDADQASRWASMTQCFGQKLQLEPREPYGSLSKSFMYILTAKVSRRTIMTVLIFILPRMITELDHSFWAQYLFYIQLLGYSILKNSRDLLVHFLKMEDSGYQKFRDHLRSTWENNCSSSNTHTEISSEIRGLSQ